MEKSQANLNPEQKKAVTHKDGPLLIVAGAGTGKTTVITHKIAWLIEQKLAKSNEILALTFTDKASEEMEERVDKLLPYGYIDLWVSTFHSFCERILKTHGLDIGLSTDFKLLSATDQWLLIRQNLDKFDLDYYRPLGNPTKFIQALINHFSRLKDEEIWPDEYLEYAEKIGLDSGVREDEGGAKSKKKLDISKKEKDEVDEISRIHEVANAYHTYQQLLHDSNYLDFGDLINYTLKLLRTRKNLLSQFQRQFKYILVDEFQDTNWAQYELVKLLSAEHKNITVVGDDDQAIYKFRGASLSNILQFEKDFPTCEKVVLTKNYRSSQKILDLSYKFIQLNNPNRLEVALKNSISKKLESQVKDKPEIKLLHAKTAEDEVKSVINKIIELKNTSLVANEGDQTFGRLPGGKKGDDTQSSWSDFAILIRANSMADAFSRGLANAKIPYQFLASKGLYTKSVIMDILAYLKLLDNYHEGAALYRMLNSPIFKISPADQSKLTYYCYKSADSLFEALQKISAISGISEESVKKVQSLLSFIEKHSSLAKEKNIGELYVNIIKDIGLEEYLIKKDDQHANEQLNYLNQFYKRIQKFEQASLDPKLHDFMPEINLEIEAGDSGKLQFDADVGPDMVKIMTVHGAKGLEFKHVFIVNLVDKRFPTIERHDPICVPDELVKEILPEGDIHLEEERRLFYVAMTRAKQGLFFTAADDYGGARAKKLSRFLFELGLSEKAESQSPRSESSSARRAETLSEGASATESKGHLPTYFSYSQLSNFQKCPLMYKYGHILHVPTFGKSVFSFGLTMHSTLQKFFAQNINQGNTQSSLFGSSERPADLSPEARRAKGEALAKAGSGDPPKLEERRGAQLPSLDQLLAFYEESWIDDWYRDKKDKQDHKEKGKKILKDFYDKIKDAIPHVQGLETSFNLRLGNYTIRGRIDRLDKVGDGVELIDYKTGSPKEKLAAEDKEQLLLYQIAAEEVLGQKPTKLTYWYLNDNKPVSFQGSDKDKEKLKIDLLSRIEEIRKSDFKATPGWQCKFCDFREICEYRAD